jgi:hypothetical protein
MVIFFDFMEKHFQPQRHEGKNKKEKLCVLWAFVVLFLLG